MVCLCKGPPRDEDSHLSINFIFLLIREKDELSILSLESVSSVKNL